MQERLTEIEIKLAHMEQSLNELSDVLYRQQGLLDRLDLRYEQLRQRIDTGDSGAPGSAPEDDKPPHY